VIDGLWALSFKGDRPWGRKSHGFMTHTGVITGFPTDSGSLWPLFCLRSSPELPLLESVRDRRIVGLLESPTLEQSSRAVSRSYSENCACCFVFDHAGRPHLRWVVSVRIVNLAKGAPLRFKKSISTSMFIRLPSPSRNGCSWQARTYHLLSQPDISCANDRTSTTL